MHFRTLTVLLALFTTPLFAAEHAHHLMEKRTPISMTPEGKVHIHQEMRLFLSTTQKIVSATSAKDMKAVAEAARAAGMAAAHEVPAGLRARLPLEFKKLGQATHQGFDDLARDAESLGDADHALKQLGQVMDNCVACHAMFHIEAR